MLSVGGVMFEGVMFVFGEIVLDVGVLVCF